MQLFVLPCPPSATSFAGQAATGDCVVDTSKGIIYRNVSGNINAPIWMASFPTRHYSEWGSLMLLAAREFILQPSAAQTLAAGTTVSLDASALQVKANSAVTLTSTPNIAAGVDGQLIRVANVGTALANTIAFQDKNSLANSGMLLADTKVFLAPGQFIDFIYSGLVSAWVQLGPVYS